MAKQQITVPDIGGAEGAEVIELLVAVGDEVEVEQGLIVLESDKASMEIPSTVAGIVVEVLVAEGEELAEGAPVAVIEVVGEEAQSEESAEPVEQTAPAAAPEPEPEPEPKPKPKPKPEPEPAAQEPEPESELAASTAGEVTIPVPDIGTEDAVELIELSVQPGDTVAEGDSLVVLESDKASMEVPSPHAGEVLKLLVSEGASVKQGDDLLLLKVEGAVPVVEKKVQEKAQEKVEEKVQEDATPTPAVEAIPAAIPVSEPASAGKGVYAGPAVRKLAREFGIELSEVSGSGSRGRLVKEDLHKFVQTRLSSPAAASAATGAGIPVIPEVDFSAFGEIEITKRSRLDKLTAANMQRSWLNVPHVTQFDDADITELEEFRAGLKSEGEKRGTRLTPMPFILKACAVALRDNPKFATSLADGGESLVYKQYCHIGMAVDTPAGLMVPVIRDVDRKTIWELAEEVLALAGKARDRKLTPADMQGGCFTISSLGSIGGTGFTPIVNPPEVGILGVSRAEIRPVWDGEVFQPRKMLPLSLSYDHRVINGGDGGRFFARLVALLGDIRQLAM